MEEKKKMKVDEWLSFFKEYHNKKLFSLSDLEVLTGRPKKNLSVQLNRLIKSGVLKRPVRNWYENPFNTPSIEEIAMVLRPPCYLSMEYALYKHDIISQQIHMLTIISIQLPYTYEVNSRVLEVHQIKKSLFWGFQKQGTIQLADPEKALLDFIYLRYAHHNKLPKQYIQSFLDSMYLEELQSKKLQNYAKRFDQRTKTFIKEIVLDKKV
jgi:hypothetical protein